MLSSPRKNGLTSLFKEVRVFKVGEDVQGQELPADPRSLMSMLILLLFTQASLSSAFGSTTQPHIPSTPKFLQYKKNSCEELIS